MQHKATRLTLALAVIAAALAAPAAAAPILTATQPWEQNAVFEPTILKVPGGYRMWYTGGWETSGTGTATSTDGVHWVKYAGNPVIPDSARNTVVRHGSKFWLYYSDGYGAAADSIRVAVSKDGVHFGPSMEVMQPPVWAQALANSHVFKTRTRWMMLFEARVGDVWKMGLASSPDGIRWTELGHPLDGGLGTVGPTYGGPWVNRTASGFRLYFHAGGAANGVLPTDIYMSESVNLLDWTPPVMVQGRTEPWEVDQVADPSVTDGMLYFAGCDNPTAFCAIGMERLAEQFRKR